VKQIKAIIVDDELAARNILSNLLKLSCPQITIAATESNLPDAVLAIKKHKPDVVFLDIEMPKYAGYQIVKFFDTIDFHIVFITAYDQYAMKAFEVNALDYLLKPIERSRLELAVKKVERQIEDQELVLNYHQLLQEVEAKEERTIVVAEAGKKHIIPLQEIVGIEAKGAYSIIHLKGGSKQLFSKNIGYFEQLLEEEAQFFRSHKSWLINTKYVANYSKGNSLIQLTTGPIAKLSRFKKTDFEQLVNH
jgi:two-component system LytT family response regulator